MGRGNSPDGQNNRVVARQDTHFNETHAGPVDKLESLDHPSFNDVAQFIGKSIAKTMATIVNPKNREHRKGQTD